MKGALFGASFFVYTAAMTISDNLDAIHAVLNAANQNVDLVAVSKRQSADRLQAALDYGHRKFGENRVQEAYDHWLDIKNSGEYTDLCLHLIGPLQSNKAADAVALFDVIETVDRPKIAKALSDEMKKQGRMIPCYIQVNTGEEDQKSGVIPSELPDFLSYCVDECGLNIIGLMCIPPVDEPPAVHFAFLHRLAQQHGLSKLSMGMSADYEKAIALGATSVRIGSGVFGARLV